jgi:hypothetical protein
MAKKSGFDPAKLPKNHPTFKALLKQGIIDENGRLTAEKTAARNRNQRAQAAVEKRHSGDALSQAAGFEAILEDVYLDVHCRRKGRLLRDVLNYSAAMHFVLDGISEAGFIGDDDQAKGWGFTQEKGEEDVLIVTLYEHEKGEPR